MAYLGTTELKLYLGIGTAQTGDDALLGSLITSAQGAIEAHCRRTFEASTGTQYYGMQDARLAGQALYLDKDLLSVTTLVNGNAATIDGGSFWLLPRNEGPPYGQIRLKESQAWVWGTDGEVVVAGTWGYSATVPADIVQATKRLAGFLYKQKDAGVYNTVTAFTEAGQLQIPAGLPDDVIQLLRPYRRSQYG